MLSLEKSEKIGKIASYTPSNRFLKLKVSSLWLKISRKYADDQTSRQDHQNQIFFYFRCLDGVYNGRNQNWFLRGIVNGFSTCQIKQFCAEVSVDRLTLTCLYIFARFPHSKCLGVGECDMTSHNIGYFLSLNHNDCQKHLHKFLWHFGALQKSRRLLAIELWIVMQPPKCICNALRLLCCATWKPMI